MSSCVPIVSEDDNTDVVSFQVKGHTPDAWSELDHFSGLDLVEANNSGNTVADADDSAEFLNVILDSQGLTTCVMFMILSWITLAVSAMPNFFEKPWRASRNNPLILVEK